MKKLINFRPIVIISLFFITGILSYFVGEIYWSQTNSQILFGIFALILVVCVLLFTYKRHKALGIVTAALSIAVYLLGAFLCYNSFTAYNEATVFGKQDISGRVVETTNDDGSYSAIIGDLSISGRKSGYRLCLYLPYDLLSVGDGVELNGYLKSYELIANGALANNYIDGVKYSYTVIDREELSVYTANKDIFVEIRSAAEKTIFSAMDEDSASVAFAMLFGDTSHISKELLSAYRMAGVAHVFAVSGLHIGFLLAILMLFLGISRKINMYIKAIVVLPIIVFYGAVCGYSASTLRAVVMCVSYVVCAVMLGNEYDKLSSLFMSAIIVLLLGIERLFSVGFILSYTTVFFIDILYRPIKDRLKFLPEFVADAVSVTASATLGSFPVLLATFKSYSLLSFFINLLFVPFVSVLYSIFFILVILSMLFGSGAAYYLLFIPNYIFKLINYIFLGVRFENFTVVGLEVVPIMPLYYLALIISSEIINITRRTRVLIVSVLLSAFAIGVYLLNFGNLESESYYFEMIDNFSYLC